jgi:Transposase DDE domain
MTRKTYASLPAELTLREVRVRVTQKGFRTKELIVVTTLLDPVEYPAEEIAELYRRRWQAELNLRSLKTVLQMDHLRCKTPHRVRNEFFMHLVAYNLIRRLMAVSAQEKETQPWQVSFKGALQTVNAFLPILGSNVSPEEWCTALASAIATHAVGDRPDRYEPRVKKRRAKEYDLMNKTRDEYKRQMAK